MPLLRSRCVTVKYSICAKQNLIKQKFFIVRISLLYTDSLCGCGNGIHPFSSPSGGHSFSQSRSPKKRAVFRRCFCGPPFHHPLSPCLVHKIQQPRICCKSRLAVLSVWHRLGVMRLLVNLGIPSDCLVTQVAGETRKLLKNPALIALVVPLWKHDAPQNGMSSSKSAKLSRGGRLCGCGSLWP